MAGLGGRTAFDDLEDELLRCATVLDQADDALHAPVYIKLARLKREKIALLTRINTGGHKRNRDQISHAEHHKRLVDDFFGTPAFTKDEVVHEAIRIAPITF